MSEGDRYIGMTYAELEAESNRQEASTRGAKHAAIGTLAAISNEVQRARAKHPNNRHMLAALMEEVGELAQAMLQGKSLSEINKEAMQCACVAIRIMEEGDADFSDGEKGKP